MAAALIVAVAFVSCEDSLHFGASSKHEISVNVSGSSLSGTRSAQGTAIQKRTFPLGDNLLLEETVSDFDAVQETATRGAIITTDGYNAINTEGKTFTIQGWLGSSDINAASDASSTDRDDRHFIKDALAERSGSYWTLGSYYWRDGIASTFWSYTHPSVGTLSITLPGDNPSDESLKTLPFSYSLPAPTSDYTDAANLQDFVIAYNYEKRSKDGDGIRQDFGTAATTANNDINVTFRHPLAAIKFIMGTISGDSDADGDEYVNITKVELVDVSTSGEFTATGNNNSGCTFSCTPAVSTATYAQESETLRADISAGNFVNANSDCVFFMIPQDLSGVKIRLTMTRNKKNITYEPDGVTINSVSYGDPIEFTREVTLNGSWESGKYYTYKLSSKVYFGGEETILKKDEIEISSDKINIDESGNLNFSVSGSVNFAEWVAPLPTKDVKVLKLTITHTYSNSSGKSWRNIWLENAVVNPEYTGSGDTTHPHYINPTELDTRNSTLVAEAKELTKAAIYWKDKYYTGTLGETELKSGGKYVATTYDNNMNKSGGATDIESTMYFYLGGQFDNVKIHFDYGGDTGGGSISWSASLPIFNITEVVE